MNPPQSKFQEIGVGRKLLNTIGKLQGKNGISLEDLKKYLKVTEKWDVDMLDSSIKLAIKKAMDKGILIEKNGNYKLKGQEEDAAEGIERAAEAIERAAEAIQRAADNLGGAEAIERAAEAFERSAEALQRAANHLGGTEATERATEALQRAANHLGGAEVAPVLRRDVQDVGGVDLREGGVLGKTPPAEM